MKATGIIASAILAAGLIAGGSQIKNGLEHFNSARTVDVKGLAEKEVKADHVIWPITYTEQGGDPAKIYATIEQNNKTIIEYLKSNGIEDNEISMGQARLTDQASAYNNSNPNLRYIATAAITVSTTKVDVVTKLISKSSDLIKKGIVLKGNESYDNPVKFEFTKLNDIKTDMLQESTDNARKSAEVFAKNSDSELGKIITCNQGQFSIYQRDEYTPQIKIVRVVTSIKYELKN